MCRCSIIPKDVLERFSQDPNLTTEQRQKFADAASLETNWRTIRTLLTPSTAAALLSFPQNTALAAAPSVTVYNCSNGTGLPGSPVVNPGSSQDLTVKRAFDETTQVASFFKQVFGRNSIDNLGMTLQSSVHYGTSYNNAFWNGNQMTYGDGDGTIFVDFTLGNDVICHELTHGVTQFSSQFDYSNEAGGLNESISDVFGSMFRQWRLNQTVIQADWLIGHNIMGPGATARGYTCLRDMANPNAAHCLAPQPNHYSQYTPGMDPHYSSGIPNLAFYHAAMALGGNSWVTAGKIWYQALTQFPPSPKMKMKAFATRTRKLARTLYPGNVGVFTAIDSAWKTVGL